MYIAMCIFCFTVTFTMISATMLSVATGIGVCGRPIYTREVRMDGDFWQLKKNPTNYSSVDDAMPFIRILHFTCTGPFPGEIAVIGVLLLDFGQRKKYPYALLYAYGSEM